MMPVAEWNLGVIIVVYVWIGIWSIYFTLDMLRDLFASAVGKHKLQYIKSCTSLQRICKTYILKSHGIAIRYLCIWYTLYQHTDRFHCFGCYACPMENSCNMELGRCQNICSLGHCNYDHTANRAFFIVTRYRGGHPRYEFDLDIKFSGRKEIEKRRELLREKKIGLLLTPKSLLLSIKRNGTDRIIITGVGRADNLRPKLNLPGEAQIIVPSPFSQR